MLCIVSCGRSPQANMLDEAGKIMEEHPDSALSLLQCIDASALDNEQERARFAIMMSVALDKNYIDAATFDLLQPAIDYYEDHGTPDDKLRTLYYQGRIYQNAGNRDKALSCFFKAENISAQCQDSLTIARMLVAQGVLYYDIYDLDSYTEKYEKAAHIYQNLCRYDNELDCLLNAVNGYILTRNRQKADSILNLCNRIKSDNIDYNRRLQSRILAFEIQFGTQSDIKKWLEDQGGNISINQSNALDMAFAYNKIGENDLAIKILNCLNESGVPYDTLKFEAISVNILKELGKYEEALSIYGNFTLRKSLIDAAKFDEGSRIIKEKHEIEQQALIDNRNKNQIVKYYIILTLILGLVVVILLLMLRSNKIKKELALERIKARELENSHLKAESEKLSLEKSKLVLEADNLSYRIEKLEEESENLKSIIDSREDLPQEVADTIKERIEMLNSLLASRISENVKYENNYDKWINDLTQNVDEFMNSNRLAFKATHTSFINYLEEHGLTTEEINYVCLYAIGLRGKEIGIYMKRPSHINTSSLIRRKLGLDKHETNLGNHIRNLLKTL